MERKDTKRKVITELATAGLQAAAKRLGATASRKQIRKGISQNIGIIDQLLRLTLMKNMDPSKIMKRDIELSALGVIAMHNFYKGFKRNKKLWVLEGIFLSAALAGVILVTQINRSRNKPEKPS
ncbi:hypothetical protein G7074_13595 [Pedobacter sp. HDW13]|uniref:hypothetical protein n=1 Tax=Pedobacter sp. HDW13 TaxID=2714940 RepID=UPI0014072322|nr:hypothetical protein [Pedobacter sp. HDW13]QIL40202.1 hypothetical protein G7074_13595 [Pedobacter sp. HDW13]